MQPLLALVLVLLAKQQRFTLGCEALRLVLDRTIGIEVGLLSFLEKVTGTTSATMGCAVAFLSSDTVAIHVRALLDQAVQASLSQGEQLTVQRPDEPALSLGRRSWPYCPGHH